MPDLDPALRIHAERLLVGTPVTVDELLDTVAGSRPASTAVEAAVRDGWRSTSLTTTGDGDAP